MMHNRRAIYGAILVGVSMLVGSAAPALAHAEHGHPVRIHEGRCEELGGVAFRLNGVGASVDLDGTAMATPTAMNPKIAYQVMVSETLLDATIDDLLAADHAVMVYESDEAMEAIACGNLGGAMSGETLVTGLAEAGVPGHNGFALFAPEGDQTRITILIGHGLSPVSAGGGGHDDAADAGSHDHDDAEHADDHGDEDHHDDAATPEA
jgi:hypothetical protein